MTWSRNQFAIEAHRRANGGEYIAMFGVAMLVVYIGWVLYAINEQVDFLELYKENIPGTLMSGVPIAGILLYIFGSRLARSARSDEKLHTRANVRGSI